MGYLRCLHIFFIFDRLIKEALPMCGQTVISVFVVSGWDEQYNHRWVKTKACASIKDVMFVF